MSSCPRRIVHYCGIQSISTTRSTVNVILTNTVNVINCNIFIVFIQVCMKFRIYIYINSIIYSRMSCMDIGMS